MHVFAVSVLASLMLAYGLHSIELTPAEQTYCGDMVTKITPIIEDILQDNHCSRIVDPNKKSGQGEFDGVNSTVWQNDNAQSSRSGTLAILRFAQGTNRTEPYPSITCSDTG
ncbi:hypothetical protein CAPTEDRAFT_193811 [Capitella teleta]|uniref:Uncharacterized protein n=1 Tax=Capitella teleta TaxID=283909 RepID=R7TC66_CAPTE|nr:hypothetical protein CAPTEDRAFT_193811 [Capitella teleta]|eukprot:ELT89092.1 hypothetical protein CAPTEDRAFT_193811 [Capitella teleta]